MDYERLYRDIRDNGIDDVGDDFSLIDALRHCYYHNKYEKYLGECIHMYLIRLRQAHPAVYAITISRFPDFVKPLEDCIDPEGFTCMSPKIGGRYDEWLYKREYGGA